ncbi:MAG: DnaA regulatory inactivator Hda [Duodenibacillus sp.]|nr:DnaA regulatory inactivator Hda [Duodenibacillus sp.]
MTAQPVEQILLDFVRPEPPTLENFVAGANAEALAALRRCAAGQGPQFLYLWGAPGAGKTHLLTAAAPWQTGRVPAFCEGRRLYAVDDVDTLDEEGLEALFVLMNKVRACPGASLVMSGSQPALALAVREDVRSRLRWGLSFELRVLKDEAAQREFERLARARGIEITPDIAAWVARSCPRDIGSLRRILEAVDHYSLENKKRVTRRLVSKVASPAAQEKTP